MELGAVLVDDGSGDGTAPSVRRRFPSVAVIEAAGDLYWAAAMARAESEATLQQPAYLLWLNDDVTLDPDALERLLDVDRGRGAGRCIVVGALRDPVTGEVTYSGVRRRGLGLHPLRVELVQPNSRVITVETFNGNVVLVRAR